MKIRNSEYYLAGSIALITFAVYLRSLNNAFVFWDDEYYVLENPHIRSFDLNFFKWAFFDFYVANWHPLTWISHALDYAIWGLDPMGHHLTNNILHAVNTFLVVLLVVRLLASWQAGKLTSSFDSSASADPPGTGNSRFTIHDSRFTLIAAGVTGLLFGLHPIHVESVAWVAERKDLLCAMFYLLSIMMYTKYVVTTILYSPFLRENRSATLQQVSNRHYPLSALAFFTLALLSKPMAVSLPLVLLILDWYPFKRITSFATFRISLIEKLPFIALSLISAILTIFAQKTYGAIQSIEAIQLSSRVLVAFKSLSAYLWKMIWPVNLIPYYPYPEDVSLLSIGYLSAIIIAVAITTACLVMARKKEILLSVWVYYVVTLLPVLGIVQVGGQSMADRYTYLPGLGPFFIVGMITAGIYEKVRTSKKGGLFLKAGCILAASIGLVFMSYTTLRQIGIWKDGITLWNYAIEKEPLKVPRAYINGGSALMDKGRIDEAIEYFRIAIRLQPTNANAHNNLGVAYKYRGLYDEAIEQFLAALRLKPDDPETHNNLGVVYKYKGLYDKAIEEHRIALNLNPEYAEAHFNLGIIYLESGAVAKARKEFEAGLKIKPDDQKARQVLNDIISR